jgi:hypothetical protein
LAGGADLFLLEADQIGSVEVAPARDTSLARNKSK